MSNPLQQEIVLELREQNSNSQRKKDENGDEISGDYNCTFDHITLNEGDELNIKACFVDSVDSNNDKIHISAEDATISITSGLYISDFGLGNPNDVYTDNRNHFNGSTTPTGKNYYCVDEVAKNTTLREVFELRFYGDPNAEGKWSDKPEAVFHLQYIAANNVLKTLGFNVKKSKLKLSGEHNTFTIDRNSGIDGLPLIIKENTLVTSSDHKLVKEMIDSGVFVDTFGSGGPSQPVEIVEEVIIPADGNTIYHPRTFTTTFTIDEGDYTPHDLAERISEKLSLVKNSGADYITGEYTDSNFLFTSTQLKTGANQAKFVASDASDVLNISGANVYWVGSSQCGLLFNDDTQQFYFQRTHGSIYNAGGLTVIKTVENANGKFISNKTGGIYFNDLKPVSLWRDKLKFDLDHNSPRSILARETDKVEKTIGALSNDTFFKLNLEDGVTTTAEAVELDSMIIKKVDVTNDLFFDQPSPSFGGVETAGTTPISIYATSAVDSSNSDDNMPYFQIEVDVGINNQKIGSDKFNNKIGGIISRFYSSNSYSSSMDNSGSMVYFHTGQPLTISSANVRILSPQGYLVDDLGNNNTVFLSVIKPK
jgi:hypothetical protein